MTHSPAKLLLQRHLIDTVERLALDFPDHAIGTISRVVHAVASGHRHVDVRALGDVVEAVEDAARVDLTRLQQATAA